MIKKAETFAERHEELVLGLQILGGAAVIGALVFAGNAFLGSSEATTARDAVNARLSIVDSQQVDLNIKTEPKYTAEK